MHNINFIAVFVLVAHYPWDTWRVNFTKLFSLATNFKLHFELLFEAIQFQFQFHLSNSSQV